MIYQYDGSLYPEYLKHGNAMQHIATTAGHFCSGRGVDVGAGKWPLPGAIPIDLVDGGDAFSLPGDLDYVFSSHALEHIPDAIGALLHWRDCLKQGGVLFLYLPHGDMRYWHSTKNRKHVHEFDPAQMARMLRDLGFVNVIHSERDLAWSFAVVGFKA